MKDERPWGNFETLLKDSNSYLSQAHKIKIITVKPNQRFSLQYHQKREEYWIVISGYGEVILNNRKMPVTRGSYVYIPLLATHRVIAGDEGLVFAEIQLGTQCEEEDIMRISDDYGRHKISI